jgi:NAD(P)-dependent dehydrogenase (short-subunit alcohol dehydrogenase family)
MSPALESKKVTIITGASGGIGAGLVAAFRDTGYAVVATSLSMPASDDADLLTVQGDITQAETAQRVVEQTLDRFGRIDSLISMAGIFISKPFTEYTADDYVAITSVNLAGFFHITQRVIGQMVAQGSGHVVNITTSLVDHADSERPAALTALTKGGLAAVTRSLAIEYASRGGAGQRGRPRGHQNSRARPNHLRRHGRPRWPNWRDQRHRRRDPVSRTSHVRHRRDPAHRRWSGRWTLTPRG